MGATPPAYHAAVNTAVDDHLQRIADVGYTIVEDAVAPDLIDEIVETLERLERDLDIRPARKAWGDTPASRALFSEVSAIR